MPQCCLAPCYMIEYVTRIIQRIMDGFYYILPLKSQMFSNLNLIYPVGQEPANYSTQSEFRTQRAVFTFLKGCN